MFQVSTTLFAPFKILFNLLLSVSFFLNFCAVGCIFSLSLSGS